MDSKLRHNLHQCPGYLREEITLASDVSKSAIISHAFPSQSEVCSICGQLVQYKRTEHSIADVEVQEAPHYPSQDNFQIMAEVSSFRSKNVQPVYEPKPSPRAPSPHPRDYIRNHRQEIEAWDSYTWKQTPSQLLGKRKR
jgi:hypothetical protein